MRPTTFTATMGTFLLASSSGASDYQSTSSKTKMKTPSASTSASEEALSTTPKDYMYPDSSPEATNGYDAVLCGQNGYSDGSNFSYNADAWHADGHGFQCMSVINGSSTTSAAFDATWYWPVDPSSVHSFPHVTFASGHLPAPLSNISALRLAAGWAMSAGTISTARNVSARIGVVDTSGLDGAAAKANVAFDMFLDLDSKKAASSVNAAYEMMIWIGQVGGPYPLGYDETNATCYTQQLGFYNFTLYAGQNSRGTSVFTWVAPRDETSFDEDISPLLQYLWRKKLVSADARLGLVEFGSEAYHSGANVTFTASAFGMQLYTGLPPQYSLNPIGDDCASPVPAGLPSPKKKGGAVGKTQVQYGVLLLTMGPACLFIAFGGGVGGGGVNGILELVIGIAVPLYLAYIMP